MDTLRTPRRTTSCSTSRLPLAPRTSLDVLPASPWTRFPPLDQHGGVEALEVSHLGAKDQVAQLSERQEDNEEHHGETSQILGASRKRGR